MCLDFLIYYRYQQAQVNAVGPPGTSHSAAPGVDHSQGQHTSRADSALYNGFSKVSQYIYISLSRFFFYFADRKIFQINTLVFKQTKEGKK